jgi:hypothetical protein
LQIPIDPLTSQASHCPAHGLLQHTPSTQFPFGHSPPVEQLCPLGFPTQVCPLQIGRFAGQLLPQTPQLVALLSWVSHPGAAVQSPYPSLHLDTTQAPFTQAAAPFGTLQVDPHVPQLPTSVLRSTQLVPHLSGAAPLQLRTQVCVPAMLEQKGVAVMHLRPQAPQFSGLLMSVSHTSSGLAEQ